MTQHPFGMILYYVYCFVIMVVLLNILIALYNSAYEDITGNADDEYMALFAQKTMQFVRAPDENVFIAPFNLIEMFLLILPLEWWMSDKLYARVNDYVMLVIYSPLLLVTAAMETRVAHRVKVNRRRGAVEDDDDDVIEEWEQDEVRELCDFETDGWQKKVEDSKPDIETDMATSECRKLRGEVDQLKGLIKLLLKKSEASDGEVNGS
jgi:hypothetical protein